MGNRDDKKQKCRQNHDCICTWRTTHQHPLNLFSECVMLSDLFWNGAGTDSCRVIPVSLPSGCLHVNDKLMIFDMRWCTRKYLVQTAMLLHGQLSSCCSDFPGLRGQTQISRACSTDTFRNFKISWPHISVCVTTEARRRTVWCCSHSSEKAPTFVTLY